MLNNLIRTLAVVRTHRAGTNPNHRPNCICESRALLGVRLAEKCALSLFVIGNSAVLKRAKKILEELTKRVPGLSQ
eukprot:1055647-Amorphochlora_amoeboformis.AAC.1